MVTIRALDPSADLSLVAGFYTEAPDYWLLAEGRCDPDHYAAAFFTDCPPGCDPAASHRLGLFLGPRLSGLAELSFGFPQPGDAYLGLMVLGTWAQGQSLGPGFLAEVERLARAADAENLYLGVLGRNPRGAAFWQRQGFRLTGDQRQTDQGDVVRRMVKPL